MMTTYGPSRIETGWTIELEALKFKIEYASAAFPVEFFPWTETRVFADRQRSDIIWVADTDLDFNLNTNLGASDRNDLICKIMNLCAWLSGDWLTEVRKGNVPGHSVFTANGFSDVMRSGNDVGTVCPFDFPQIIDFIAAGGSTISFASTSANDTVAGTGARVLLVTGLDSTGTNIITETMLTNGQTPVVSTSTFLRFRLVTVVSVGSLEENEGRITFGLGGDTYTGGIPDNDMLWAIAPSANISTVAVYTVPLGKTALLEALVLSGERNHTVEATIYARPLGTVPWLRFARLSVRDSAIELRAITEPAPAGMDLRIDARVNTGVDEVTAILSLIEITDPD